jgi:hypothetical protein
MNSLLYTRISVKKEKQLDLVDIINITFYTVPWLRRLVAGLSPRRPGFDPGSVYVGFMVD